jgi:hypothetical protein
MRRLLPAIVIALLVAVGVIAYLGFRQGASSTPSALYTKLMSGPFPADQIPADYSISQPRRLLYMGDGPPLGLVGTVGMTVRGPQNGRDNLRYRVFRNVTSARRSFDLWAGDVRADAPAHHWRLYEPTGIHHPALCADLGTGECLVLVGDTVVHATSVTSEALGIQGYANQAAVLARLGATYLSSVTA